MKNIAKQIMILMLFQSIHLYSQNIPNYVPLQGLVSYYPLDGNANDLLGVNNGTQYLVTPSEDRYNQSNSSFQFNGFSYIDLSNDFDYPFRTINLWIYADKIDSIMRHVYVSDHGGLMNGFTQFRVEYMQGVKSCITNACNGLYFGSHAIEDSTWYMLTISVSYDSVRHYINGVKYHHSPVSNFSSNIGNTTALLGISRIFDRGFIGKIDEVGIWNTVLSDNQIIKLYTPPSPDVSQQTETNITSIQLTDHKIIIDDIITETQQGKQLTILDSAGRIISQSTLRQSHNEFSVNTLCAGVYIVKYGQEKPKKFVLD